METRIPIPDTQETMKPSRAPLASSAMDSGTLKPDTFQPGKTWLDDRGKPIESHLGGIYYENGVYYWYGMNFDGETMKPGSYPGQSYAWMINQGVTCYSSKDLHLWKLESVSLSPVKDDATHPLQPTNWVLRAKVLKCAKTGNYVMMGQLVSADFKTLNKVVVGVADKPQGPFTYQKLLDPPGGGFDMTLYQDDDGLAYLICSHGWVKAHRLSDDYLTIEKTYGLEGVTGEAPAVFKQDGTYYFLTSSLTGWAPNANQYAVAPTFLGPYEPKGTFCVGPGEDTSFGGQTTFVLPLAGKPGQFIWMADRFNAKSNTEVDDFRKATHIWLPITLDSAQKRLRVEWRDQWDLGVLDKIHPAADSAAKPIASSTSGCFLFSYFVGNGEDGLHLAWSRDGLNWAAINGGKPLLKPAVGGKLLRDPSVVRGPDGVFYMVWSSGWSDLGFGWASSKDLIHWSEQRFIAVNADVPGAKNTWSPDTFYDAAKKQFAIIYSTTIPGRFPDAGSEENGKWNHRHYLITTSDFKTFSKPVLFYDPGYNSIDGTLVQLDQRVLLIYKDERPGHKRLHLATAPSLDAPFTAPTDPILARDWVEGPSVLKVGNVWRLFFDCYTKGHYGAAESEDGLVWRDITDKIQMPKGMRHGTAFAVSCDVLDRLLQMPSE